MTTKLNQLLAELCPEGVEIKKVWEVTKRDKKFNSVVAYKQREILSFKHISAKELKELVVDN
jgi:conserved domain protein